MERFVLWHRFFVSTCAFAGAGWFGDWFYNVASTPSAHIPTEFWVIIVAAVVAAWLITFGYSSGSASD